MAEIGLVASIVAVIQITTSVAKQAHKYGQSFKNATQDMAKILDQLKDVETILVKLKDLTDRETKSGKPLDLWPTLLSLNSPNGALEQCRLAMTALGAELTPAEGIAKFRQRICWPLTKKKVEQSLEKIGTLKNVFLELLSVEHMGQTLKTAHTISQISKAQSDRKRNEIIRWLSQNTDPEANHNESRKKHEDNTGKWFTDGEEYFRWKEEPNAFLWLYGLPGCGKTVLCSEIIEQTQQHCADQPTDRVLVYFYFSFQDTEKQKAVHLLRSILSQLVRQVECIPDPVVILYDNYLHSQPPTDRLLSAIKCMTNGYKNIFLIIDALDECPNQNAERSDLCNVLREIKDWAASNLHVLVTSRREVGLVESLDPLCTIGPISIQGPKVQSDIRRFIRSELSKNKRLSTWPADIRNEIELTLVQGANGMFRWVDLQLESLKKCLTHTDIRKALASLPKTLSKSYERILLAIDEEHRQKVFIALQWISHCCRPITIEELAEAVIIDPTATPPFNPYGRIPDPHWLLELLSGFVVISKKRRHLDWDIMGWIVPKYIQVVEIAHLSVKEYLNSNEILSGPARTFHVLERIAIEDIIQRSLLYLNSYSVSNRKSASLQDLDEFPLLLYVSHFWHEHVLTIEDILSAQTKNLVYDFLNSETSLLSWIKVYQADNSLAPFSGDDYEIGPPLYYLAFWGAYYLVRDTIERGADINARGGTYSTALQAAAFNGKTNILKLLLGAGAEINARGGDYGTALQAAASNGSTRDVRLLLEAGADINAQGGEYGTALHAAAWLGDAELVKILIEAGADVNANVAPYGTAIEAAFNCDADEHIAVIELLLAAGADTNRLDDEEIRMIGEMGSSQLQV